MQMRHDQVIPILDFGAQYAQLIARRVREQGVYSELVRPDISPQQLKDRLRKNPSTASSNLNAVTSAGNLLPDRFV